ncbi:MAG: pseudaminic acid cytidylyltransferase [Bacteroidales bacterium]|nr:pseudaminic acid cytidylyltransferase [Bacteroidales bacterium]
MSKLCIIPARGGSKRIPRKNIKLFMGKPIMAYSIEAALKSGLFDEVMVSTDDEEFAEVARQYGASVPFLRSEATANDYATTADVLNEVLERYREIGKEFDSFCCLYSTAPFVTSDRLKKANEKISADVDACFTMVQYSYPAQRGLQVNDKGYVEMTNPEYLGIRSQDLKSIYHDAGQFYFIKTKTFETEKTLWAKRTAPLILSELEMQDIDTETDWKIAEMKYKLLINPGGGEKLCNTSPR